MLFGSFQDSIFLILMSMFVVVMLSFVKKKENKGFPKMDQLGYTVYYYSFISS